MKIVLSHATQVANVMTQLDCSLSMTMKEAATGQEPRIPRQGATITLCEVIARLCVEFATLRRRNYVYSIESELYAIEFRGIYRFHWLHTCLILDHSDGGRGMLYKHGKSNIVTTKNQFVYSTCRVEGSTGLFFLRIIRCSKPIQSSFDVDLGRCSIDEQLTETGMVAWCPSSAVMTVGAEESLLVNDCEMSRE